MGRTRRLSIPIQFILAGALTVVVVGVPIAVIDQGAQRDVQCSKLTSLAMEGNAEAVQELLRSGADVNCDQGAPLKGALRQNHPEMAEFLRKAGAR